MKCNGGEGGTVKREKIGVRLADVSRRMKEREEGRRERGGREEGRRSGWMEWWRG